MPRATPRPGRRRGQGPPGAEARSWGASQPFPQTCPPLRSSLPCPARGPTPQPPSPTIFPTSCPPAPLGARFLDPRPLLPGFGPSLPCPSCPPGVSVECGLGCSMTLPDTRRPLPTMSQLFPRVTFDTCGRTAVASVPSALPSGDPQAVQGRGPGAPRPALRRKTAQCAAACVCRGVSQESLDVTVLNTEKDKSCDCPNHVGALGAAG